MSRLVTYSDEASAELAADNEHATDFYKQLFLLHEISIELSRAKSLDDLYRLAVIACLTHLGIDRMGILMIDKDRDPDKDWMVGTWGTDEQGDVRSEQDFSAPMLEDVQEVIEEMSTKGKVCVWHDKALYEFGEKIGEVDTVGHGWNAAIAIWDGDEVVGWIACDNLINHKPFQTYQSHTLRLFGSLLGEFIKRRYAEEAVTRLNDELEDRILARTQDLSKAQKNLEKTNALLEERVMERTALLNEKTNRLQDTLNDLKRTQNQLIEAEKQSSIAHLVMGMAHELNTPLGNIKTVASLFPDMFNGLKDDISTGNISRAKLLEAISTGLESYDIIDSNVDRMADLVAQFKRLSIKETQHSGEEEVTLQEWLEHITQLAIAEYGKPLSTQISIAVSSQQTQAKLNTWRMAQVMENLIFNSLDHGLVNHSSGQIKITAAANDDHLSFNIEDNGKGIAPELLSSIFDPFVTTARGSGSKGLGLHLVYNLVTQGMNGSIDVYQPASGGCGFTIKVPHDLLQSQ
ncbi:ATP-binding protein [uncultured Vibrio sp.]|uniref:sensor histidine kinase n=1 Tax=uncultured Vibrio sp. TaxID=114054 RepID=UPI0025CCE474|nr:ATP-binding protein [uncultured Vibrio sp.]